MTAGTPGDKPTFSYLNGDLVAITGGETVVFADLPANIYRRAAEKEVETASKALNRAILKLQLAAWLDEFGKV